MKAEQIFCDIVLKGGEVVLREWSTARIWKSAEYFNVDHRAEPDDYIEGLNAVLEAQGSSIRFVLIDCGDDNYYFGVAKRACA